MISVLRGEQRTIIRIMFVLLFTNCRSNSLNLINNCSVTYVKMLSGLICIELRIFIIPLLFYIGFLLCVLNL